MPATSADPNTARALERRTILRAGAWSVPVIATAIATPLAAASTTAASCDPADNGTPLTINAGSWSTTSGALKSDENQTGWYGTNGFRSWDNNASTTQDAVVTATFTFAARAGATYTISATVQVGAGNSPIGVNRQNVWVDVVSSAGAQKLTAVHTSDGNPYPDDIADHTTQYTWDSTPLPYSTNFVAPVSETVTLRYRFTLLPTADVNDDIWINNLAVTQVACNA